VTRVTGCDNERTENSNRSGNELEDTAATTLAVSWKTRFDAGGIPQRLKAEIDLCDLRRGWEAAPFQNPTRRPLKTSRESDFFVTG
jgi:hypothetical protein